MKNTIKDTMKDTTEVLLANGGVLGLSLSQCNDILLLISTSLAIVFTFLKKVYKTYSK